MAQPQHDTRITLRNATLQLQVDLAGGAITSVLRHGSTVNPLSFRFTKQHMPANNRKGAPYQGHFACIGRWGEPSAGEIKAGLPNHGGPANSVWQVKGKAAARAVQMTTHHVLEGLQVHKSIALDAHAPVFRVTETITNTNPLGRLMQVVQHPTLAAPFLTGNTIVQCNATKGFEYRNATSYAANNYRFPKVSDGEGQTLYLDQPGHAFNSVYSFLCDPHSSNGWITAYAPEYRLLFGYVWPRNAYPWISLWQHFNNEGIQYRGLEFGNTCIHLPYAQIIEHGLLQVWGERTADWIDAGARLTWNYAGFLCHVPFGFKGVRHVEMTDNNITIFPVRKGKPFTPGDEPITKTV